MSPYWSNGELTIYQRDCLELLPNMPIQHFHAVVTSPPYFALRSYLPAGHPDKAKEIGSETTPDDFVATMVEVFRQVRRVLRDDGVCWVNLGDSYARNGGAQGGGNRALLHMEGKQQRMLRIPTGSGLKEKDLIGIPWRVGLALQADGWYLRDAIIWHKPSPMPGSQRDRCTSSYEFVFQLTKKPRYFFDLEAIKERSKRPEEQMKICSGWAVGNNTPHSAVAHNQGERPGTRFANIAMPSMTVLRNVWTIASEGFSEAHFATFPLELAVRCIRAATSEIGCCAKCGAPWQRVVKRERRPTRPGEKTKVLGKNSRAFATHDPAHETEAYKSERYALEVGNSDEQRHVTEATTIGWEPSCDCGLPIEAVVPCRVLDPFGGAATTLLACKQLGRHGTAIELNEDYCELAVRRLTKPIGGITQPPTDPLQTSLAFD